MITKNDIFAPKEKTVSLQSRLNLLQELEKFLENAFGNGSIIDVSYNGDRIYIICIVIECVDYIYKYINAVPYKVRVRQSTSGYEALLCYNMHILLSKCVDAGLG